MRWNRILLASALVATLAEPALAGIIFNRHAKTNPAQRVQELISTLQTDSSERKREDAAEELRHVDASANPEVVPVLIQALQSDPKPGVRIEAAQSLSKLRPVSQQVGAALEQALAQENSVRARLQVRTALWQYHMAGYRSNKPGSPAVGTTTQEPPLAPPLDTTPSTVQAARNPQPPPRGRIEPADNQSVRPAPPAVSTWGAVPPRSSNTTSKPMPKGPSQPPLVAADPPPLQTPPPPLADDDDGPELTPPQ